MCILDFIYLVNMIVIATYFFVLRLTGVVLGEITKVFVLPGYSI